MSPWLATIVGIIIDGKHNLAQFAIIYSRAQCCASESFPVNMSGKLKIHIIYWLVSTEAFIMCLKSNLFL